MNIQEFSAALIEAISTQNRRDIERLMSDPLFLQVSATTLNNALMVTSPILQEREFVSKFFIHPNFNEISPEALAKIILLVLPLPYGKELQFLLQHKQLEKISLADAHKIVSTLLQFQDRRIVADLAYSPLFHPLFEQHHSELTDCAIRTQNIFWLDEILKKKNYHSTSSTFITLIRWGLDKKKEKIIVRSLQTHQFTPESETLFTQELVNTFNEDINDLAETIVDELVTHPNFPTFSTDLFGWILFMSILYVDEDLFKNLITHAAYPNLIKQRLTDLSILAMKNDLEMAKKLFQHPNFMRLSGSDLGLLLETLNVQNFSLFPLIANHLEFNRIPEDHFRRMPAMDLAITTKEQRNGFLDYAQFKNKYGEMIYEAIRRNDCEFLRSRLLDPMLKEEVLNQFKKYASSGNYFVNEYTVRDILREIILSEDIVLIEKICKDPLFEKRLPALAAQAAQFNDELLLSKLKTKSSEAEKK